MSALPLASLTLPEEIVLRVRARVVTGEFADEAEVIVQALQALEARDDATEYWLRTDVVAAWEEHLTDPSHGCSLDQVRAGLQSRFDRSVLATKA